jgi:hypothetical protein
MTSAEVAAKMNRFFLETGEYVPDVESGKPKSQSRHQEPTPTQDHKEN